MALTFESNYRSIFSQEVLDKIDELSFDNQDLMDMIEFVDKHGEENFLRLYDVYLEECEKVGDQEIVDSFVENFYIENVEECYKQYVGSYDSEADFVDWYIEEKVDLPSFVEVDYQKTWEKSLKYDFVFVNGHVFRNY